MWWYGVMNTRVAGAMRSLAHNICFYTANMPAICTMCVCVCVFNPFLYKDIHQRK